MVAPKEDMAPEIGPEVMTGLNFIAAIAADPANMQAVKKAVNNAVESTDFTEPEILTAIYKGLKWVSVMNKYLHDNGIEAVKYHVNPDKDSK